jgi:glycosyltransferase involved in cell wall biosynthesis
MNDPDPAIGAISKVVRTGPLDYEDLPQVADLASVLIMPYADLPATRAMQPLKLKEYLATGKPCVVSALPAVHEWRDACDVVASAEEFSLRVLARLQTGLPSAQADARARLSDESWQQKARNFEAILLGKSR